MDTLSNPGANERPFYPVPLKHDFSVPGLYAFHAKHSPDHPVFTYSDLPPSVPHDVTYADAWRDIRRIATVVSAQGDSATSTEGTQKRQTISILALSGMWTVSGVGILVDMIVRLSQLHLPHASDHEPRSHRVPLVSPE